MAKAHQAIDRLAELPQLRDIVPCRYDREAEDNLCQNLFRGASPSYVAVESRVLETRPAVCGSADAASVYVECRKKTCPTDCHLLIGPQKLFGAGSSTGAYFSAHIGVRSNLIESIWALGYLIADHGLNHDKYC